MAHIDAAALTDTALPSNLAVCRVSASDLADMAAEATAGPVAACNVRAATVDRL